MYICDTHTNICIINFPSFQKYYITHVLKYRESHNSGMYKSVNYIHNVQEHSRPRLTNKRQCTRMLNLQRCYNQYYIKLYKNNVHFCSETGHTYISDQIRLMPQHTEILLLNLCTIPQTEPSTYGIPEFLVLWSHCIR